ncbi:UDP-glucose 4-epimerase [Klebsormidium nitens]|uniref:UDP-glucose 4-epimerase n=1 Tax=Klebsormidium nitens TaxID=105231 RepID=A0A1Y1ITM0_KLENI|nr:UDP-glucose 4-epimerase [Klebsormidium nitens]|eukprot:GAQ92681.1 UDP-glucose 4-epimerase [Klebsormidium nitens]
MGGWPASSSRVSQALLLAGCLLAAVLLFKYLSTGISYAPPSVFSQPQKGVTHVLVTGGAGFIGSHATLRLLSDGHRVTIVDNLSRGNLGAVRVLQRLAPAARLQFVEADLGDLPAVERLFARNHFDAVMHFAAVAFVGESVEQPLQYYHNITANTLTLLEAVQRHGVKRIIYSSTCATYGEPDTMPITEDTPQRPINPYGLSKKMAEDMIRDFSKANPDIAFAILRYFNVIGSDPEGRLGEWPRPALRHYGRISGACFDAAMGHIPGLKVMGTNYPTRDGTCIRDYIHVTDLVDAHVAVLPQLQPGVIRTFNVGTGKGYSVREFVDACLKVTGKPIKVVEQAERRPGDYAEVFSDPSKIQRELGWQARFTDLEENLRMAWAWRKEHPSGY